MAKYSNNFVPEYMLPDLPWYECDGLSTWYNQAKCQEFLRNSKEHFNSTKTINFDITYTGWLEEKKFLMMSLRSTRLFRTVGYLNTLKRTGIIFYLKHLRLKEKIITLKKK